MAIYTLATGIDQFKGSRGGVTFQRSGTSFAIRTRKKPIFHRTQRTADSRSRFHHVQSNFRTLSTDDRATWYDEAVNFQRINSLGETYEIPGINLFAASNIPLVNAGFPMVDAAGAPVTFPNITYGISEFEISPLGLSVAVDPNPVPSNFALELWFSPVSLTLNERYSEIGLEPIIFDFQQLFKPVATLLPDFDGSIIVSPAYEMQYGPTPNYTSQDGKLLFIVLAGVWLSLLTGQRFLDIVDPQDIEL